MTQPQTSALRRVWTRRDLMRLGIGGGLASLLPNLAVNGQIAAADAPQAAASKSFATDEDRRFFKRELESFLPDKVFDAHAHLYKRDTG